MRGYCEGGEQQWAREGIGIVVVVVVVVVVVNMEALPRQ